MLDALNSIVDFLNLIIDSVVSSITYSGLFIRFIVKGVSFLYQCLAFIPDELQAFALITIVLMVVLLIVGRSNNSG